MSYKETINLPDTDLSMRAGLSEMEPELQKKWREMDLHQRLKQAREGQPRYVLHDGPPYPTGDLHLGTGLNKILKDFFVRFAAMRGYQAPYVPGWDCHGLPIELQILQQLGEGREEKSAEEIRELCREHAMKFVELQKEQFQTLGIIGDWDNPYLTLNNSYEAGILEVFQKMVEGGYVYRDLRPIHWCYHCRTALAQAELEYEQMESPSIYVNFPVQDDVSHLFPGTETDDVNILIWTTTPWTLPANLAVAVNPSADYTAVRYTHPGTGEEIVSIMADFLSAPVLEEAGVEDYEKLGKVEGTELLELWYRHPFMERESPVVPAEFVSLEEGTGCVHTAPGHGAEDYEIGLSNGLDILSPVDDRGYFTARAGMFEGQHITEGDESIVDWLVNEGYMLHHASDSHSYPHCWRCHNPVIFRATSQWFVELDHEGFRDRALDSVGQVRWVPEWGEKRISEMIRERPDWCISRQRYWGVPIPAFYCAECGEELLTPETVESVKEVFAERGADSWFEEDSAEPFLPDDTFCPSCGSGEWEKENDIFDVWFESGSSHHSVCRHLPGRHGPVPRLVPGLAAGLAGRLGRAALQERAHARLRGG